MIPFREIDPIEQPPKIEGLGCKAMVYGLFFLLAVAPGVMAGWIWYAYNFWIGAAVGLFLYLISGFVSSKLRLMSLPPDQREKTLSSLEIARWYIGKNHCF
ncbi:MAG: hypothetical protein B6D59_02660 [Campylobacteraceae bacterium 4484_4]|nr:MAG: hypothetical protein B6D59_02660 [Campylobacteraceae bacterium 4484_4]